MPLTEPASFWRRLLRFGAANLGLWAVCVVAAHAVTAVLALLGVYRADPPDVGWEAFVNVAFAIGLVSLPAVLLYLGLAGVVLSRLPPPWFRVAAVVAAPVVLGVPVAPYDFLDTLRDPQLLLSAVTVQFLWVLWLLYGATVRPFPLVSRRRADESAGNRSGA